MPIRAQTRLQNCIAFMLLLAWLPSLAAATLQGTVHDAGRRPIAGATVTLQPQPGGASIVTKTDTNGSYQLTAPPGNYTLAAQKIGFGEATSGPFDLPATAAKTIDLTLQSAFYDEPTFVVAGVTDANAHGGHGSDTVLRSAESLAKSAAALRQQTPAASEDSLRAAMARDPNNAELHHSLAGAEERAAKPLDAVRDYQRAAELAPNERNLFDWAAELLMHRAPQPAIEVFTKGRRLFPQSTRMLLGLASALYAHGDYDQAARQFFAACDLNPADPTPYLFLAKIQAVEITQLPAYLDRMRQFARVQPDNPQANYQYAVSLWKHRTAADESPAALKLLETAVRLNPNFAAAWLQLGIIHADRGDFTKAISNYRQAIAVDPKLEEAHYRLAQAYGRTSDSAAARKELDVYQKLSKESAAAAERERSEIPRFLYTLRDAQP